MRAELAKVQRLKSSIVDRLLECSDTPLGDAMKERFNQADKNEAALRMQLDELSDAKGAAACVKPTKDSIIQALTTFEETVAELPATKVKQIVRLLVNDIKVTRIDHTSTPRFTQIAASSMVLKFDLTLSPIGIHYSNSPALSERWLADAKNTKDRKAKLSVTFEIYRSGPTGNKVRLLEPFSSDAKIIDFNEAAASRQDSKTHSTPLSRLDEIQRYLVKGLRKKAIAAKFGKTAAWVSYHLRLVSLSDRIVKALGEAKRSVSDTFGLVRLMRIAAIKGKVQQEAAFDLEYRRALHGGFGRRRLTGSLTLTSPEDRASLIAQFQSSGVTMAAFAEKHGIKYATFAGWIACHKRSAAADSTAKKAQ